MPAITKPATHLPTDLPAFCRHLTKIRSIDAGMPKNSHPLLTVSNAANPIGMPISRYTHRLRPCRLPMSPIATIKGNTRPKNSATLLGEP